MAKLLVNFLMFLALVYAGNVYSDREGKNITLGSKLYPAGDFSHWLSPSGTFAFGFYNKGQDGFALCIWLQTGSGEPIITWTANRDYPPLSPDSYLEFTMDGRLVVHTTNSVYGFFEIACSSQESVTAASLLDSGNFVLYAGSYATWESFDHPTDTILGGQTLRYGHSLVSGISMSDRSSGRFKLVMQQDGELVASPVKAPGESYWSTTAGNSSGLRNLHLTVTGQLYLDSNPNDYTVAAEGRHIITQISNFSYSKTTVFRATLDVDGNFRLYMHNIENVSMMTLWSAIPQNDHCKVKGYCGVNSYCSYDASKGGNTCFCFPGFNYSDPENTLLGCYRNFIYERFCGTQKDSSPSYNFRSLNNTTIGGYPYSSVPMAEEECPKSCMNDCNCWAALYESRTCRKYMPPLLYAIQDKEQSGVTFIKQGRNSYCYSAHGKPVRDWKAEEASGEHKKKIILILVPSFSFLSLLFTLLAVFSFSMYRRRAHKYQKLLQMENFDQNKDFTLRSFSYSELEKATNGFKEVVGTVSYGKIYEGMISEDNRTVAAKRLEKVDDDGEREFLAEMTAMGRIHHKNIIKLVGFCLEGAKKVLVYEFLRNRSLANVLHGVETRAFWKQRVKLVLDIARGIHYLHEECDTPIVHCSIRPENILVGDNWTAKISNFKSAKLLTPSKKENLGLDGQRSGYTAPEWQKKASASEKLDVYSYGVVLLEIICCNSSEEINVQNPDESFFAKVHGYFEAKELRKLVGDEEEVDMGSLERMVKVALCCVHNDPGLRPSMRNVLLMLEGTIDTPVPQIPASSIRHVCRSRMTSFEIC